MAGITAQGVPIPDDPQPPAEAEVDEQAGQAVAPAQDDEPDETEDVDEPGKHEAADGGEQHE